MAAYDTAILCIFTLFLTGAEAPSVIYPFIKTCAVKGSTVTLPCTFTPATSFIGQDKREVQRKIVRVLWCQNHKFCTGNTPSVFDSNSTSNNSRYRYLGDLETNCTLQIRDIQKTDDSTFRFRMEANHSVGHFTNQTGVKVTVVDGVKLRIKVSNQREFRCGQTVSLQCTSPTCTIHHHLEVTWFRDNHALPESGHTLQLHNLTAEDSGNYTCSLKTNMTLRSEPLSLEVEDDPEDGGGLELRIKVSNQTEFRRGQTVSLQCTSLACTIHQLEVTWFRDNHALPESGHTLQLHNLTAEDSGKYTCGLKTNMTLRSEPFSLRVEDDPEDGDEVGGPSLILGGVSGFLLVVMVLVLVYFIIRKRAAAEQQRTMGAESELKSDGNIYSSILPPAEDRRGTDREEAGPGTEDVSYAAVQFQEQKPSRRVEEATDVIYSSVASRG